MILYTIISRKKKFFLFETSCSSRNLKIFQGQTKRLRKFLFSVNKKYKICFYFQNQFSKDKC